MSHLRLIRSNSDTISQSQVGFFSFSFLDYFEYQAFDTSISPAPTCPKANSKPTDSKQGKLLCLLDIPNILWDQNNSNLHQENGMHMDYCLNILTDRHTRTYARKICIEQFLLMEICRHKLCTFTYLKHQNRLICTRKKYTHHTCEQPWDLQLKPSIQI